MTYIGLSPYREYRNIDVFSYMLYDDIKHYLVGSLSYPLDRPAVRVIYLRETIMFCSLRF